MKKEYPIIEFDPALPAVIEPSQVIRKIDISEHAVICFFQDIISKLFKDKKLRQIATLKSEIGENPVYEMNIDGRRLAVLHPGVEAPLAAGFLEEIIALGCRKFIACGGAGVLNKEIAVGHVIVPDIAVRDEGTSYHYLPAGREVKASKEAIETIKKVLAKKMGCVFLFS